MNGQNNGVSGRADEPGAGTEAQRSPRGAGFAVNAWSAEYLDGEYERYRADPQAVPADVRAFFQGFELAQARGPAGTTGGASAFQSIVVDIINAYREQGHLAAKIDPFDRPRGPVAALNLATYGLTEADLDRMAQAPLGSSRESRPLREIIAHLESTYCGSIALEFMHIRSDVEREWFLTQYEDRRGMAPLSPEEKLAVLEHLTRAEAFETFCHKRYGGEKRFSLEGGISLIPLLAELIERAGELGVDEMILGMAHRGRLNVLNNILGKSYEQIFTEFEDNWDVDFADGGGDVKYHRGYSGSRTLRSGRSMHLAMANNPSHLESVNGVVLGRARAKQRLRADTQDRRRVVPLVIHGDAAIAGQGVVAECLNMSQLEGYRVGGCLHVVVNNMIGFTTIPEDARSTTYCTDIAKSIDAPIFHVNGEDPEACVAVARLAMEYRQQFKKDAFIDIYCYRKYGHNEQDDQSFTQPILAKRIRERASTLKLYLARLLREGIIDEAGGESLHTKVSEMLNQAQEAARRAPKDPTIDPGSARWKGFTGDYSHDVVPTGVGMDALRELCAAMGRVPPGFEVNPKLVSLLEARRTLCEAGQVTHAEGELLGIGSLLLDGHPVRLSGQDCRRGTFTQRHAVLRDFTTGAAFTPLNNVRELGEAGTDHEPGTPGADGRPRQAKFCVWDSPLSEFSVLGFDYGYSVADPNMLVMWEAQFGDFCNGAQVIIDQYISSAESKWERWSGLTMLLPHGYEGAGPEHSSARMERFLKLCADDNMQVVCPSTAAQMFHLLRRQMKRNFRKPLIVFTPKSMLRVPTSTIQELAEGHFHDLVDDASISARAASGVRRVVFCTGKLYHELNERRLASKREDVAIVRVEQLYPFNAELARSILARYPRDAEFVWAQEEPRNAGGFQFISDVFEQELSIHLRYVGRQASPTPAVGSKKAHKHEQEQVISGAIAPLEKDFKAGGKASGEPAPAEKNSVTTEGKSGGRSPAPRATTGRR